MATNPDSEAPVPAVGERFMHTLTRVTSAATDTGPQTGVSLRIWLIVALLGAIVSVAVFPLNVVGVVAIVALALTLGSRSRGGVR